MEEFLGIPPAQLGTSFLQTIYMMLISLGVGSLIGIPLAFLMYMTRSGGISENKIAYKIIDTIVNIIRSIPFVILLVFVAPLTKLIVGTRIGTSAAIVPLTIYIAPYVARLVEGSLLEVDEGIIEAANSMGASTKQIIRYFLLPEARPSLILALSTATIGLLGATAMAGTIGGGGIGDLALTYGYERFNDKLMLVTVIILVIFVQIIQSVGNNLSEKFRRH